MLIEHLMFSSKQRHPPPLLILFVGIILGKSPWFASFLCYLTQRADDVVIPTYTVMVLLYLTLIALRKPLGPILSSIYRITQRVPPQEKGAIEEIPVPIPEEEEEEPQPINLSGAYKLVSNDNFEPFLEVQGVPWALRRAANQARPLHRITHRGRRLTIRIEGIIESQTTCK